MQFSLDSRHEVMQANASSCGARHGNLYTATKPLENVGQSYGAS